MNIIGENRCMRSDATITIIQNKLILSVFYLQLFLLDHFQTTGLLNSVLILFLNKKHLNLMFTRKCR